LHVMQASEMLSCLVKSASSASDSVNARARSSNGARWKPESRLLPISHPVIWGSLLTHPHTYWLLEKGCDEETGPRVGAQTIHRPGISRCEDLGAWDNDAAAAVEID